MCLAAWYTFKEYDNNEVKFILLFNRDEFFSRKTKPLHKWKDADIIAARDYDEKRVAEHNNGTWLGVNLKNFKVSFLTNSLMPGVLSKAARKITVDPLGREQ